MAKLILEPQKPVYRKLPFLYFIFCLSEDETLKQEIEYDSLRRIVTNLYVYASLFALSSEKKSKSVIDHSLRDAVRGTDDRIRNIVIAAKTLRINCAAEYKPNPCAKFDELVTVYTIMDKYESNTNWISSVYSQDTGATLEHFVIPDQRAAKIRWQIDDTQGFDIELDQDFARRRKNRTCNFLIIDRDLNGDLNNYDIVKKIEMIQRWYLARGLSLPAHIEVFFSFIQEMPEYQVLQQSKNGDANEREIKAAYQTFLNAYFSEEKESALIFKLEERFKAIFRN